ncbi:MAG: hypothetical protein ACLRJC_00575 [Emergencia timonensis]|uniref:hypothetical protein n=1 Tax=Emergencia timonensis TaxID=1776384 RepID=UPI00082CF02D|nr:hypothetical protein [Emergencia timonensis]WNX89939.1 esterase [Emergencia timonensis]
MSEAREINKQLEVTPITTLKEYAKGELVEFPPFAEGQSFVARVKRPSMMVLMKTGKIPNSLMMTANALFTGDNSKSAMDEDFYREVLGVIEVIAEASLVEPSWKELQDEGIELTDDQYTFLFNYTQKGIKALEPFRGEQPGTGNN